MGERNWTDELEAFLRERFAKSCATAGQPIPFSGLRFNPPLGSDESKYFLLGLEAGLFEVDDEGNVQSELLPAGGEEGSRRVCPVFRNQPPPPRFFRETVCQLSTASSLIHRRGWLRAHIQIESPLEEHRLMANGADLFIRSSAGALLVSVKVKRSVAELEKLIMDLQTCFQRGVHARDDCGFPQNHPTYEFCTVYRPLYFWGVAPGSDVCFQMKYDGIAIEMEQLRALPPRSVLEFS